MSTRFHRMLKSLIYVPNYSIISNLLAPLRGLFAHRIFHISPLHIHSKIPSLHLYFSWNFDAYIMSYHLSSRISTSTYQIIGSPPLQSIGCIYITICVHLHPQNLGNHVWVYVTCRKIIHHHNANQSLLSDLLEK